MSLDAILEAIEASGQEKIDEIQEQAEKEAEEILETARKEAQNIKEDERQKVLRSARRKRAHLLHEASSQQLKIRQKGREHIIEKILEGTRQRLQNFRSDPEYGDMLRRFNEEALKALLPSLAEDEKVTVETDSRDRDRIEDILSDSPQEKNIMEGAESWGGVTLSSQDGRVRVINTLEARLERAIPYLHTSLYTRFEKTS